MNPLLEVSANEAETIILGRDNLGIIRTAKCKHPYPDGPLPLWLKARAQALGIRRDDIVRTHWRKVWRSMVEE